MYCHTSISVQLEIGTHGSALPCAFYRWIGSRVLDAVLRSHWPKSSRWEKKRSFALAFSSSRRAPPIHASKLLNSMVSKVVVWRHTWGVHAGFDYSSFVDRLLYRTYDEVRAHLFDEVVTKLHSFWEVVTGINVYQWERNSRPKALRARWVTILSLPEKRMVGLSNWA